MVRVDLLLLAILLGLPSANYQIFDGLPLSSWPEFVGLALLIPFLMSRALRRLYARWTRRWPHGLRVGLLAAAATAVALKVVLLASGGHAGFLACYRSPLQAPPTGPCERSFENPFYRFAVTRIDPAISFREHEWDLGFLNTQRFNFYYARGSSTGPLRWRIPIAATWQGVIERAEPWVARVTYVGEVGIAVGTDGPAAEPEQCACRPTMARP